MATEVMTSIPVNPAGAPAATRNHAIGCLLLLLVAIYLVAGPYARFSDWHVDAAENPGMAEALAWHEGRLDLPHRMHDSALYDGRVYNVFPPLFTLLAWFATWLGPALGAPDGQFPSAWLVTLVALPVAVTGYAAFLSAKIRPGWAALFAAGWILGTPILPALATAREGGINHISHLLSQTGLMLIAISLFSGRRFACGLIGILIAAWSRPLCILFALPLLRRASTAEPPRRKRRMIALAVTVLVSLALPMGLSWAKFGSPIDSGYKYLYQGRDDDLAQAGRRRLFSLDYVPKNLWYMNIELPGWESGDYGLRPDVSPYGASIWFTMPILVLILIDFRRVWRDSIERWTMLASFAVVGGLLCFHNTGYIQPGYYRFALDFIALWLVIIARHFTADPWRARLTIGAFAWSILYFNLVTQMYS
ncbi:MAG: hypothetical protein DCC65_02580 [Planctomycetota bacterium]|nr:MAG: hypothetical protein DCC65_02580 [Planctomycetota bacterium]